MNTEIKLNEYRIWIERRQKLNWTNNEIESRIQKLNWMDLKIELNE